MNTFSIDLLWHENDLWKIVLCIIFSLLDIQAFVSGQERGATGGTGDWSGDGAQETASLYERPRELWVLKIRPEALDSPNWVSGPYGHAASCRW